ncbi:hypothetical protein AzCIB_0202 [Azoarcus sp. CIB]|uniref:PRC-barrel domain-containing protein n=1 Tax=Aromatoleum sp. (strain CIB) TaxID=198107 RepID=UPI00067C60EB|nr:PRC-barrel domain-containing protein [Azoarcus sp. CIB]AKU10107.1 hypothetical protein AzCIB_0202 [Azoarcus sp. CIB]
MSSMKRKSLLAIAVTTLVAVPLGAAAADQYSEGQSQQQHSRMSTSGQLKTMTPSQLRGTQVVGTNGEHIGSVKTVVQSRQDKNIQAVIATSSAMGGDGRDVTVPLDRMRYEDGKLRLSASADDLRTWPTYRGDQYVELRPMDQPLSEFSAFETVPDRSATHSQMRSGERGPMWRQGSQTGAESRTNAFYPETQQFTP